MPRPLAIKSWAKQALFENKQDVLDLREAEKELDRLEKDGADRKTIDDMRKRVSAMKKRAVGAAR